MNGSARPSEQGALAGGHFREGRPLHTVLVVHPLADILPGPGIDRIRDHSSPVATRKLDSQSLDRAAVLPSLTADQLARHLGRLEKEWDLDRSLILFFGIAGGVVLELARRGSRGALWLLRTQLAFLAWHAIVGWCPPVALLRRLGFRSAREIDDERAYVRALLDGQIA